MANLLNLLLVEASHAYTHVRKLSALVSRHHVKIFCDVCTKEKSEDKMFTNYECWHSYCTDCFGKHITAMVQENIYPIICPGIECQIQLDPDDCESLVPQHLFDRWMNAIFTDAQSSFEESFETVVHFLCEICMEKKPINKMFDSKCSHSYCCDCISRHIAAKVQENIHLITCPHMDCKSVLDPEDCKSLIPQHVFDRWIAALCESFIPASQKFYCPFKDCSEMFVDDGGQTVTTSECPRCHRLFCAQCKVPWHADQSCNKHQRMINKKRDDMVVKLAKENKWMKCPSCKYYVEKTDGCVHITCRCRFQFCYRCGKKWTITHACR